MRLKVMTPERVVIETDTVEAVYAQSAEGRFGVLPKHVPMVAQLAVGLLEYTQAGQKHPAVLIGGILETDGEAVTILTNAAEKSDEIDALRAQHAKERAEARLRERDASTDVKRAEMALSRALLRLKLAGK